MDLSRLHDDKKWAEYHLWLHEQLLLHGVVTKGDEVSVRERIAGLKSILVGIERTAALFAVDDQRQSDV